MILTGFLVLCLVVAYLGAAVWPMARLGISFRQAVLYLPFKLAYRIDDRQMRIARGAPAPVLYVISHHSRLDPALMLALLPADTLHILDEAAARSPWLEPWRELARTIPFNAEHVFVSRRLVRVLKGKGRLAVYLPGDVEPDSKASRLTRAVARIASKADATVVPIWVRGRVQSPTPGSARATPFLLPKLATVVLPPMTIAQLMDQAEARPVTMANALSEHVARTRLTVAA